ncbi:hypothetical protein BV25DRAFT_1843199 [Artomyces pyxidatus]|uniref:Uncharacterized protein n=1 Tax=Artomyces pyxidatus TaxID=48021 RepID=A0ACB8SFF3_9AGAM|nr:hypothetical protein BV25DRAFT_1843199 [Artomyces pyxidatus]
MRLLASTVPYYNRVTYTPAASNGTQFIFPSTLDDYCSYTRLTLVPREMNPFLGVVMGKEFNIPTILPAALYMSSVRPDEAKIAVIRQADNSHTESFLLALQDILLFNKSFWGHIFLMDDYESPFFSQSPCNKSKCTGITDRGTLKYLHCSCAANSWDVFVGKFEPQEAEYTPNVCPGCLTRFHQERMQGLRVALWSHLPEIGQLAKSWDTLLEVPGLPLTSETLICNTGDTDHCLLSMASMKSTALGERGIPMGSMMRRQSMGRLALQTSQADSESSRRH